MNAENSLLDRARQAASETTGLVLAKTAWHPSPPKVAAFDGVVQIRIGRRVLRRSYLVRNTLNPSVLHLASLLKRESNGGLLVITSHVNDRNAGLLKAAGVNFMDVVGNVFLDDGADLLILVTGRRPPVPEVAISRSRAFHPSGLKLLFALLTDRKIGDPAVHDRPLVSRTYREIEAATGLPHSTVGWIMADLIRQGFVIEPAAGERALIDRKRILEQWVQGYMDRLRPALVVVRYRPAKLDWWRDVAPERALWSGEVAAAKMTGQLKPGTAVLFGDAPSHSFVLRHGLQKDPHGAVEFLRPFWRDARDLGGTSDCVHPLLVYADLLCIDDDRTREVAEIVYDRHLRPFFETT